MAEMLYQGKVKQVWSTDDPDILEFRFTNQISVFDQIIPSLIPRKGESLNRTTAHWFKLVEQEGVCGTHLVELNGPDRCLVRKVDVIKEPGCIPRDMRMGLCTVGNYLYDITSLARLGAVSNVVNLLQNTWCFTRLLNMVLNYQNLSLKLQPNSKPLIVTSIVKKLLKYRTSQTREFDSIVQAALKIDDIIEREAAKNGLIHVDGKKEFALGPGRKVVLVDTFGTLDEDRWWDAEAYSNGECIELSKEFVRTHYINSGHQADLKVARDAGTVDPPIPALPQSVIDETASLYSSMYERLTSGQF